jgi:hypothetical protein
MIVDNAFNTSFVNTEELSSHENNLRLPKKHYVGDRFIPMRP